MTVVRIIASQPVRYSLNNGFALSEFDPGEYYDVPANVVAGMLERGWAELATPPEAVPTQPRQTEPSPPPQPKASEPVEGATKRKEKAR